MRSNRWRQERNNVWYNCLVTLQYDPSNVRRQTSDPNPADWRMEVCICSRLATKAIEYPQGVLTSWEGDGNVTEPQRNKKYFVPAKSMPTNRCIQKRMLRQSRLFITYSLHHAITAETEGQLIMKKMADAAYHQTERRLTIVWRCRVSKERAAPPALLLQWASFQSST